MKRYVSGLLQRVMVIAGLLAAGCVGQAQSVLIHEIMYHPPGTNVSEAWIELHNPRAQGIDLAGWRFTKGVHFTFPAQARIEGGGYLVIAADVATFAAKQPQVTQVVGGWSGTLSPSGEEIELENDAGQPVSSVFYAPEGDWAARRIGPPDRYGRQGWEWFAEHDGGGSSIELVNPALRPDAGQNWASSLVPGGTPGRSNSVARTNAAPLILDVAHAPIVPRSADPVSITARIVDELPGGAQATLWWRVDGAPSFNEVAMVDDGAHGDGLRADGVFGAVVPPQPNGVIIEFYLTASDADGHSRFYPKVIPHGTDRSANLVYQVDDSSYSGHQPLLRLVLPQAEYRYLSSQIWAGAPSSDAQVNGTWISSDGVWDDGSTVQLRYSCSFRNRGHGTRTSVPHNVHVAFPKDQPWKGRAALNLNTEYTHSQQLGSAIFRRLGMPMAESRPVQVRFNGVNLAKPGQEQFGSYAANDRVDDRLATTHFPLDDNGNLYRGVRDMVSGTRSDADLAWRGSSWSSYTNAYAKENNKALNDWSDFIQLVDVLNHAPDEDYVRAVSAVVNVNQWMKYFAINTLLANQENSLGIGAPDDFALYRGHKDTRFQLIAYDMDALMGRGLARISLSPGLWRMTNVVVINRFMKHPEFVPLYYRHLVELGESAFAPRTMNPLLDHWFGSYVDPAAIDAMKVFNSNHVALVLSVIPRELTVDVTLPVQDGYYRTAAPTVSLYGKADPIRTRGVRVNGSASEWIAWQGVWAHTNVALVPGLNRVVVQAWGEDGSELDRNHVDIWCDVGVGTAVSGSLATDKRWKAQDGPYAIHSTLTVNSGVTLIIEPGTTVFLGPDAGLVVAEGGRLLAEGMEHAPLRFTRAPGSTSLWNGLTIHGTVGSPETRITHAHLEFFGSTAIHADGGTVFLDHLSFGTTDHPYLSLDAASFVVSHCTFPSATSTFELVHGTGGVKQGGRGLFVHNFFGVPTGYNDVVDFTGGNRPAEPIVQFINNVFAGATDDVLDLDGADAWVEGNIFLHVHRNGSPDSASAISGGSNDGDTSEVTILGNLFYDCDHAVTAKQGNFYTLLNNTIVRQTKTGGVDTDAAVVNLADDGTSEGAGVYLEANIIADAERLLRNFTAAKVTMTHNLMNLPWEGAGGGNAIHDPLFMHVPEMAETTFRSWDEAQVMRRWLSLRPGSPARGTGPASRDRGGVVPVGIALGGLEEGTTNQGNGLVTLDAARIGQGIPASGFPAGSGYTHYRWRLDDLPWSDSIPTTEPILLTNLMDGVHRLEVAGRRDSGTFQDDPENGGAAAITSVRWTVDRGHAPPPKLTVRLNEILARNIRSFQHLDAYPDLIELVNPGSEAVDLSGMGLTDDPRLPYQFTFPSGTIVAPGAFLVVIADAMAGGVHLHSGFGLKGTGDALYLFDRAGGAGLLDALTFGLQIDDFSIGRRTDETWGLCRPTFGAANVAVATGDPMRLKINEWLADAQFVGRNDFVELYNPEPWPVALGGLFLSDAAGAPERHPIAPLSFVAAKGFVEFIPDGDTDQGPHHLGFGLSPDIGVISLSAPDLSRIDAVDYGSQRTDVSEGRTPNGSSVIAALPLPTPGGANPGASEDSITLTTTTLSLLPLEASWRYYQKDNLDGVAWYAPDYADADWPIGAALLGVEDRVLPPPGLRTPLVLGPITFYFRTSFVVETNLAGFRLHLTTVIDDGAVIYLNGVSILTNGMDAGIIDYATRASRSVGTASLELFTLGAAVLVPGTNVIAAEVHQTSSGSSDVVWGLALEASRTVTNYAPGVWVPVVLNEIRAGTAEKEETDAETVDEDFIELYNPSNTLVDLSDMSLTDEAASYRRWVFSAGSLLGAGEYRVIPCRPSQSPSATNTSFHLKASGGSVFLFDALERGGALIDAVQFGLQTREYSVGRHPDGRGAWSLGMPTPVTANTAAPLGNVAALRLNEWMADDDRGSDWFEIFNTGPDPVSLAGVAFTDDLADKTRSVVPPLSFIGTGGRAFARLVADDRPELGAEHVRFSLRKSGESLGIYSPAGILIDGLAFGPQTAGVSEGRFPDGAPSLSAFPQSSSPGESNYLPLQRLIINEVLPGADLPFEVAIELLNPTPETVDISGWFLSDAKSDPRKWRIPDGTVVAPGSFHVIYEQQFLRDGAAQLTFDSIHGGVAMLSETDVLGRLTGYRGQVAFGPSDFGDAWGRYPTSIGNDFVALRLPTFGPDQPSTVEAFRSGRGSANSRPQVGPMVISEIAYSTRTNATGDPLDEFVELLNISSIEVRLFDPTRPNGSWGLRDAVDYDLPTNTVLQSGQRLVVVGWDATDQALVGAFRDRHEIPANVGILGPWIGQLSDEGDDLKLVRPGGATAAMGFEASRLPEIPVERVAYRAQAPWPVGPADQAFSIERILPHEYGNEPSNWRMAIPSPGRPESLGPHDTDDDGLADLWELMYFGNLARDGSGDLDADGMLDREEYAAVTDPSSARSALRVAATVTGASVLIQFSGIPGHMYTIQFRNSLMEGPWEKLAEVPPPPYPQVLTVSDPWPIHDTARFYRVTVSGYPSP